MIIPTSSEIVALIAANSWIPNMTENTETRLLKDWNPQEGDVFRLMDMQKSKETYTIQEDGRVLSDTRSPMYYGYVGDMTGKKWQLVSRAKPRQRTFGELSDAEKGALFLAHHEGKRIEVFIMSFGIMTWSQLTSASFFDHMPYRIAPTRIKGSVETDADGKPMFDTWEANQ